MKRQILDQRQRVRRQILVGQHRALGAAGGAGGVEDRGEIVGARAGPSRIPSAAAAIFSAKVPSRATPRLSAAGRPSFLASSRVGDSRSGRQRVKRGLGVAEEIFELGERIGGVQRQQRRPRPQAGEHQHDRVGRLVDLRRHPVARLDAEGDQRVRRPAPSAR